MEDSHLAKVDEIVSRVLGAYRNTNCHTTGQPPTKLSESGTARLQQI